MRGLTHQQQKQFKKAAQDLQEILKDCGLKLEKTKNTPKNLGMWAELALLLEVHRRNENEKLSKNNGVAHS